MNPQLSTIPPLKKSSIEAGCGLMGINATGGAERATGVFF